MHSQLIFTYLKSTIEAQEKTFEVCSKLTIKTPTTSLTYSVSTVDFEQVNVSCTKYLEMFNPLTPGAKKKVIYT